MNKRMKLMLAVLFILATANILKYSGALKFRESRGSGYNKEQFLLKVPVFSGEKSPVIKRNIFEGPGMRFAAETRKIQRAAKPEKKELVIRWPVFSVSGVAQSGGERTAFLSGRDYSGAVEKGQTINEGYTVFDVGENKVVLMHKETESIKTYYMEGR